MKKRFFCLCLLWLAVCFLPALRPAAAGEEADPERIGVQIPWTPSPSQDAAAPQTPAPEGSWIPEEEYLSRGYTAQQLLESGLGNRILLRGMQGNDVALLQQRLSQLGYLEDEADGRYGRKTLQAVTEFQRKNGLEKLDGKAGPQTLNRLFSDSAIPNAREEEVPPEVLAAAEAEVPAAIQPAPTPAPMPTPDRDALPFPAGVRVVYLGEAEHELVVAEDNSVKYYPLAGVLTGLGFSCEIEEGSWAFRAPGAEDILIFGSELEGRQDYVMGSVGGLLFMEEETAFAGQRELFVPTRFLRRLGLCAVEAEAVSVIWKP